MRSILDPYVLKGNYHIGELVNLGTKVNQKIGGDAVHKSERVLESRLEIHCYCPRRRRRSSRELRSEGFTEYDAKE